MDFINDSSKESEMRIRSNEERAEEHCFFVISIFANAEDVLHRGDYRGTCRILNITLKDV